MSLGYFLPGTPNAGEDRAGKGSFVVLFNGWKAARPSAINQVLRPQASFHTTARRVAKPIHIFTTSPVLYTVLYIFPSAMGKLCFYVYPVYFPVVENATF